MLRQPVVLAIVCLAIALLIARPGRADTIVIDRSLEFFQHTSYSVELYGNFYTFSTDVYRISDAPVDLTPGMSYDALQVTLTPAGGGTLVVDFDPAALFFRVEPQFEWSDMGATGSSTSGGQVVSYVNLTGTPPTTGGGVYALSDTGYRLGAQGGFNSSTSDFSFDQMIITNTFPAALGQGPLYISEPDREFRITMQYSGQLPDPGRFTFIVPEPASVVLLMLGGATLLHRRRTAKETH